jgi:hypothetical protein
MKTIVIAIIAVLIAIHANTQVWEKVPVKKISGIKVKATHSNFDKAKDEALKIAFNEALNKAEVPIFVQSYLFHLITEENYEVDEFFESDVLTETNGAIKNYEIKKTKRRFTRNDLIEVELIVDVEVYIYEETSDPSLQMEIKGMKQAYKNDEGLKFEITPTKDNTYLRVFVFADDKAFIAFPNDTGKSSPETKEKSFPMKKDSVYKFPFKRLKYKLTSENAKQMHRIFFVLLKEDIPYTKELTIENCMEWILGIPLDKRMIRTGSFIVYNDDEFDINQND